MSNQAEIFETSGDQIAHYSGNDIMSCEIKVEEDSVHEPECSSLNLNSDTDFFTVNCDVITVIDVARKSENPILIVTQNGNTYRCNKRTKSDKTKKGIFLFACTKRSTQSCPFRFQAKMTLTEDPKNIQFWTKENWEIFKVFENHTCVQTKREPERIKQKRARVKNGTLKKSGKNDSHEMKKIRIFCENLTEIPTIVSVFCHAPTSKRPIILLKENGKNYRCRKADQNQNQFGSHTFICSKRESSGCSFRMFAKMVITNDPSNENFWSVKNWEISDFFARHTCSESALIGIQ